MNLFNRNKYTFIFSIIGILIGLLFPVFSYLLIQYISNNVNLLLLVIATAPLFLGLTAGITGKMHGVSVHKQKDKDQKRYQNSGWRIGFEHVKI